MSRAQVGDASAWRMDRSGVPEENPATFATRAAQVVAGGAGSLVLLVDRSSEAMSGYLVGADDARTGSAAEIAASALGAKATRVPVPELTAKAVRIAHVNRKREAARSNQVGADVAETSKALARSMPVGSWLAVAMRPASDAETRWWRRWFEHRLGSVMPTHHSLASRAQVVQITVGAESRREADDVMSVLAASLPGFDMSVSTVRRGGLGLFGWVAVTAAVWGLGWLLGGWWPAAAWIPAVMVVAAGRGVDPRPAAFARPGRRVFPPRRPRSGDGGGRSSSGDYPLPSSGFMVAPHVVLPIIAPQAGADSGATSTAARPVPMPLREPIGPYIGDGEGRSRAHLAAMDLWAGVFAEGRPGSGKSKLLQTLWAWHCAERVEPSGVLGSTGADTAMIAFENKGEAAPVYMKWARDLGDRAVLVDLADPQGWALDMFGAGDAVTRAGRFVEAMRYAFGDDSIGYRSVDTLKPVIAAGLCVDDQIAADCELPAGRSPIFYAHVLLGGAGGDARGVDLYAALVRAAAQRADGADLPGVVDKLAFLYGPGVTPSQRRALVEAPRSKVSLLGSVESWFSPERRRFTWERVLAGRRAVVVNTGPSVGGQQVESQVTEILSAMLVHSLREQIEATCTGWREAGSSVCLFGDELKLLVGKKNPEIVTWFREQGRAMGVRLFFATQFREQLPPEVQYSVMGYSTLVEYQQANPVLAEATARDFALDGSNWQAADFASLPQYTAAVRTHVDGVRQPAFTVAVRLFDGEADGFVDVQRGRA